MAFNGVCLIRRASINSADGRVHLDQEHNREILAIARAAIATNKNVLIQTEATTPWAEV